jgi:hypothetical protein
MQVAAPAPNRIERLALGRNRMTVVRQALTRMWVLLALEQMLQGQNQTKTPGSKLSVLLHLGKNLEPRHFDQRCH